MPRLFTIRPVLPFTSSQASPPCWFVLALPLLTAAVGLFDSFGLFMPPISPVTLFILALLISRLRNVTLR